MVEQQKRPPLLLLRPFVTYRIRGINRRTPVYDSPGEGERGVECKKRGTVGGNLLEQINCLGENISVYEARGKPLSVEIGELE